MDKVSRRNFLKNVGSCSLGLTGIIGLGTLLFPNNAQAKMVLGPQGQLIWMNDAGEVNVHKSKSHPEYNGKTVLPKKIGLRPEDIQYPEDRLLPEYQGETILRKGKTNLDEILRNLNSHNVGKDEVKKITLQKFNLNFPNLTQSDFTRTDLYNIAYKYSNDTIGRINMTIDFANHYNIPKEHIPRIIALFNQESGFNPKAFAQSSTATGITQILSGTAKEYGIKVTIPRVEGFDDRLIDSVSIDGGVRIIKDYVNQIKDMYWNKNQAYENLDGVYFAGVKAWRNKRYPEGLREHRYRVEKYIETSKEIFKKHQKLRK